MRLLLAAAVLSAIPVAAGAQSSGNIPLPDIGPRLPQIGLPLSPIGLPPTAGTPSTPIRADAGRAKADKRRVAHRKVRRLQPTLIVLPIYGPGVALGVEPATAPEASDTTTATEPAVPETGQLRFDVQPRGGWQVSVDGYYVGTSDDVDGGLELEAGPHRVEIRSAGYDPLVFDVMVAPRRRVTWQGALRPVESDSTPVPPRSARERRAANSAPIYLIPGCYIGNVAPADAGLPPHCDPGRAVVVKP